MLGFDLIFNTVYPIHLSIHNIYTEFRFVFDDRIKHTKMVTLESNRNVEKGRRVELPPILTDTEVCFLKFHFRRIPGKTFHIFVILMHIFKDYPLVCKWCGFDPGRDKIKSKWLVFCVYVNLVKFSTIKNTIRFYLKSACVATWLKHVHIRAKATRIWLKQNIKCVQRRMAIFLARIFKVDLARGSCTFKGLFQQMIATFACNICHWTLNG